jgi:cytochrome c peroxidase
VLKTLQLQGINLFGSIYTFVVDNYMNNRQQNIALNNKFYNHKGAVVLLLLLVIISSSGWSYFNKGFETGPYQFVYPSNFGNRINIPDDNPTTKQGVYLGRMLFYEKKLSVNNTISCASCHQQEKAFTDGKAFGKGVDNNLSARNSMSLANLLWTRKFFWDGRAASLEEQAVFPLTNPHEMGQTLDVSVKKISGTVSYKYLFKAVYGDETITADRILKAIAQFERTLISCNSRYDRYLQNTYQPTPEELKGVQIAHIAMAAPKLIWSYFITMGWIAYPKT